MQPRDILDVDVHLYLRAVYKRRWLAGAGFLLVFLGAVVYAVTATPIYRASARLLIEPSDPNVVTFQEVIVERNRFGLDFQTTQRDMLRSRSLARATIESLDLWNDPALLGGGDGLARFNPLRLLDRLNPINWLGRMVSWLRGTLDPPVVARREGVTDRATRSRSRAISALQGRLQVVAGRNSRVVTVSFSSRDPRVAADVANTIARLHVERDMAFRYTSSRDASEWLQQRIAEQRQELERTERSLQRYREEHGAAAIEDRQNIIVRELENLHAAATEATLARIEREARYRDLQAVQADADAVTRFPEILRNEFIQEQKLILAGLRRERARLAEELGPRHPEMVNVESSIRDAEERLQNEVDAVVDSLRIEFQVAASQEQQLLAELAEQTDEALALDRTGIEYGVMRREAESSRRLYESLLQRAAETGVTGELETSNIRIIDEAETPLRPVRPRRQLVLLFGLLGGAVVAFGLVGALELVDDRIRTPEAIKDRLEVPFLGMVPYVESGVDGRPDGRGGGGDGERRPDILIGAGAPGNFVEAIRSVRTSLIFSSAEEGCRTVLVTSTAPAEGKSCVSANLAVSLAHLGMRTLLVDADLRRPQQHASFDLAAAPGLSNLVVNEAKTSAAIRKTRVKNLSLMPAGVTPPNPSELLGSGRFEQLMASIGEDFDWMVFDSPPVLPVADSLVTARVVGNVLFVVGADSTSQRVAKDALGQLSESGARVVGAVFNKANLRRHPYYYSRYYRRSYERYYQAEKHAS